MKIGGEIFRQMQQKSRSKPDGLQEISVQNDGKFTVKICISELISGYLTVASTVKNLFYGYYDTSFYGNNQTLDHCPNLEELVLLTSCSLSKKRC